MRLIRQNQVHLIVGSILLVVGSFVLVGCGMFDSLGRNAANGAMDVLDQRGDTTIAKITGGAVQGARDTLTAVETQRRLSAFVDSLLNTIGGTTTQQLVRLRDSVLADQFFQAFIKQAGSSTKKELGDIRDELLGSKSRTLLANLLSDSLQWRAGLLRNELLGAKTQSAIQLIVDSAMTSLARRYREDLKPEVQEGLTFLQKNVTTLLVVVAGLAIAIIGFVWWQKRKHLQLLYVLTHQIDEIPNQGSYDELVRRIRSTAVERRVEPQLRQILNEQGINT